MWKLLRNLALVAILLAGVLKLLAWYVAGQAVQRAVVTLAPYAQIKYDGVSARLDGRIDLSDITVTPVGSHRLYRADSVTLEPPGLYWLLTQGLAHSEQLPAAFGISVRGLKLPPGLAWLNPEWIDTTTFVPFPAQGCGKPALSGPDYLKMGVSTGTTHEHLDYRYDARAHSLDLMLTLTAPGFSRMVLEAEVSKFEPAALVTAALRDKLHVDQLSAEYNDLGYLQRRSRFCAEHVGIAPKQFIARHVAAVLELLKQSRITPSDELLQLYRKLLADGGKASILSLPSPNFGLSTWRASTPEEVLRQLNVTARYQDSPPIMLRLAFAPPPDSRSPDAIPAAESITPPNPKTVADAPEPATTPLAAVVDQPLVAPSKPVTVPRPDRAKPAPAIPLNGTKPASTSAHSSVHNLEPAEDRLAAMPQPRHSEPPAAVPQTQAPVHTSAPPPPANSTLALVWKNTIEDLPEATPEERDYNVIEYAQLAGVHGRRVRLLSDGGKLVEGYVVGADAGGVQLRVIRNGGAAQFEVPKSRIRQIQLLKR